MLNFIGFAGSTSAPSKTRALVEHATELAARHHGGRAAVFDINDLGAQLGSARHFADLTGAAGQRAEAFLSADAVVVGSPIYKGSYTGLFKHFLDLLDPLALKNKPVLLLASGGGDRHALVIEHQLRPVFGFFEAATLPTGVYASERDFADGKPASPALLARIEAAVAQFGPHLAQAQASTTPRKLAAI